MFGLWFTKLSTMGFSARENQMANLRTKFGVGVWFIKLLKIGRVLENKKCLIGI
jgi:hypothetical protein